MGGKVFVAALFSVGIAHADLKIETKQQLDINNSLLSELETQKQAAAQAYSEIFELAESAVINRQEQVKRLKEANQTWDEFALKICRAEALESIGTRAEHTNNLKCLIKKYKDKQDFFYSLI